MKTDVQKHEIYIRFIIDLRSASRVTFDIDLNLLIWLFYLIYYTKIRQLKYVMSKSDALWYVFKMEHFTKNIEHNWMYRIDIEVKDKYGQYFDNEFYSFICCIFLYIDAGYTTWLSDYAITINKKNSRPKKTICPEVCKKIKIGQRFAKIRNIWIRFEKKKIYHTNPPPPPPTPTKVEWVAPK